MGGPLPTTDPMEPFGHQVLRVSNTNPQLVKSTKLSTAFWVHFEMEAMEQTFRCRTAKAFLACSGVAKRTSLIQYAKLCKALCIAENQPELSLTHKTNWDLSASSAPTLAPSTWRGGRWRAPNKPLYFDLTFWNAEFPCSTHFVAHLFSIACCTCSLLHFNPVKVKKQRVHVLKELGFQQPNIFI